MATADALGVSFMGGCAGALWVSLWHLSFLAVYDMCSLCCAIGNFSLVGIVIIVFECTWFCVGRLADRLLCYPQVRTRRQWRCGRYH